MSNRKEQGEPFQLEFFDGVDAVQGVAGCGGSLRGRHCNNQLGITESNSYNITLGHRFPMEMVGADGTKLKLKK